MNARAFTAAIGIIVVGVAAALVAAIVAGREQSIRVVHVGQAVAERTRDAGIAVGPPDAAVVVRVFSDFQCPACRRLDEEAGAPLRRWAAEGRLRYVHVHAPLRAHRRGPAAAAASYCAARDGRAWDMHRILAGRTAEWSQGEPPEPRFIAYARSLGIDSAAFAGCLGDPATAERVRRDLDAARALAPDHVPMVYVDDALLQDLRSPAQILAYVGKRIGLRPE